MISTSRKVTPHDLGRPKVKINVTSQAYSHKDQASTGPGGVIYTITWNATQTFNSQGKPCDKDNDK